MNPETDSPPPPAFSADDILYVLNRHKWKIVLASLLTIGAAAAFYVLAPVPFRSQAKFMVRYLVDKNIVDGIESSTTGSSDRGRIVQSQVEILTSRDIAEKTVARIGASRFLGQTGQSVDGSELAAVYALQKNLKVDANDGSGVITVTFENSDPALVQPVLDEILKQYATKHLEIYRPGDSVEVVREKIQKSAAALQSATAEATALKESMGILSVEDAEATLASEISVKRAAIEAAEAELAERKARVAVLSPSASRPSPSSSESTPAPAAVEVTPPSVEVNTRYQFIVSRLAQLRQEGTTLVGQLNPGHEVVRANERKVEDLERRKRALEATYPALIGSAEAATGTQPVFSLETELAAIAGAEAKLTTLREGFATLKAKADRLREAMPRLAQAERTRAIEEENYNYMGTSLQKAQTDATMNPGNIPYINFFEPATPPAKDSGKRNKIAAAIAASGPALSTGLVVLFGLFINRTLKRPQEFERKLNLPLMVSIPFFGKKNRRRLAPTARPVPALNAPSTPRLRSSGSVAEPWEDDHFIRPYAEAIRDRVNLFFEMNRIVRVPKLIAVTGVRKGAGASTLAAGLAAAFSRDGAGRVLMVDMNVEHGGSHPFFDGCPSIALSRALESSPPMNPASDNLFVAVGESPDESAASVGLSKLSRMIPDIKMGSFDYVIFDMPPLGQTSPTAVVSGLMDKVLVVVGPESTTADEIERNHRDLTAARANTSYVFNQARTGAALPISSWN